MKNSLNDKALVLRPYVCLVWHYFNCSAVPAARVNEGPHVCLCFQGGRGGLSERAADRARLPPG